MSDVTIKQLAKVLGTPIDKLLTQLGEAGMKFSDPEQVISSTEKVKLLGFLRRTHGKKDEAPVEATSSPRQITLKRRTVSEITVVPGQRGASAKTVNVEVRQKRTYVKRSVVDEGTQVDPEREDAIRKLGESQAKREAEELARNEADRRRQEEDAKMRAAEEARRTAVEEEARRKAESEAPATVDAKPETVAAPGTATEANATARETERARPERAREATAPPSSDAQRHKPKHGSHRMRDEGGGGGDAPGSARYFGNELHLSREAAARRTGRKRPTKGRHVEQSRSGPAHAFSRPMAPVVREIAVGETINVAELAQKLAVKGVDVVKALFKMGVMVTIN